MANHRVKFSWGDRVFEAEGDKAFILDMLKRFEAGGKESLPGRQLQADEPPMKATVSGKQLSVGEFIRQLQFKKHTDLVLAFGYYLEKFDGLSSFAASDINKCYYDAKLEPSNTSQMITRNIQAGRMMEAKGATGKRNKYTLTQSGLQRVEASTTPKAD